MAETLGKAVTRTASWPRALTLMFVPIPFFNQPVAT